MANRLTKIVTRTGDDGSTGLADGSRLPKNGRRIHCLGEVDELNAHIGLCASIIEHASIGEQLLHVQHDLFDLGAELCQPGKSLLNEVYVDWLTASAGEINERLPPLQEFILPGGSAGLGHLHLARTVCRRAERSLVELQQHEMVNPQALMYLNRLSDLLFILARQLAKESSIDEVRWQSAFSRKR